MLTTTKFQFLPSSNHISKRQMHQIQNPLLQSSKLIKIQRLSQESVFVVPNERTRLLERLNMDISNTYSLIQKRLVDLDFKCLIMGNLANVNFPN